LGAIKEENAVNFDGLIENDGKNAPVTESVEGCESQKDNLEEFVILAGRKRHMFSFLSLNQLRI